MLAARPGPSLAHLGQRHSRSLLRPFRRYRLPLEALLFLLLHSVLLDGQSPPW